jgi:hypothetical protein
MKFLILLLILNINYLSAQSLNTFESNGKWGYKNDKGKTIIPTIYDYAYYFNEMGIAPVVKNNKIGFIDLKGKEITQFVYDYKDAFLFAWVYYNENYQGVFKNKNAGLIDKTGKEIIPCSLGYQEVGFFNQTSEWEFDNAFFIDGYCPVKKNNKWGFINLSSNEVIKCQFDEVKPIKNGLFAFRLNGKWGIRDINNKVLIPAIYDNISDFQLPYHISNWQGYFSFGLCPVSKINAENEDVWGYINKTGDLVIPYQFSNPERFNEKGIIVAYQAQSKKCSCINSKGKDVNKLKFDLVGDFEDGIAIVQNSDSWNGAWGCINENCDVIIPFEYDYIGGFENGKSLVEKEGMRFYINKLGQKVSNP